MPLDKEDIKQFKNIMIDVMEPFMGAIQRDFGKQDKKTDKIEKKVTDIKVEQEAMFAKLVSLDRRVMYIKDGLTR